MEQTSSTPPSAELQQQQTSQIPRLPATTSSSPIPSISSSFPPPLSTPSSTNPNPTASPNLSITQQSQTRPPFNTRPWQQPPLSPFSLPSPPLPSSSASASPAIPSPTPPRGGIAVGIPAHPSPPPASFSSLAPPSYGQPSQITQAMQGMGMTGALGTTSAMRPGATSAQQLRPSQSSLRPQSSPSSQSPASQSFQGHGMLRGSVLGSPVASPSPSSSQTPLAPNQPWLSSIGKPPLPASPIRPATSSQPFQQRSITQQYLHATPTPQQQQPVSSSPQSAQPSTSGQEQEHYGQQVPSSRIQQPTSSHQQQIGRVPGLGSQKLPVGSTPSGTFHLGTANKTATSETEEASDRIVTKRSIQELVNQIDPSEKLEPEVEDILADIAEDFVESITTFGCSLAKHRKSTTLEAKDILLHLERNWNMTLPGFGGDEIKTYKKPFVSDIHRERLAAVKKSMAATDMMSKNTGGPSSGNAKVNMAKGPASLIGSPPNPKIREAA